MSDNVVDLSVVSKVDTPPAKVLATAAGAGLTDVVVVGWKQNGFIYFASSSADAAEVNWLLDNAKQELIEAGRT